MSEDPESLTVANNQEDGWVGSPSMESGDLTHADESGRVRMVDVSDKPVTTRQAIAVGRVSLSRRAASLLRHGALPKGDGLAVVRVAAIMGVKQTANLIPLCQPIGVDGVVVDLDTGPAWVDITVTVTSRGRTGAEMEALTGVMAAGLTVIDMIKAVDHQAQIEQVRVVAKSGGRSGAWSVQVTSDPLEGAKFAADKPSHTDQGVGFDDRSPVHDGPLSLDTGIVIISDRRSVGLAEDLVGPFLVQVLDDAGAHPIAPVIVPDEVGAIRQAVLRLAAAGCRVILTSGGTGASPRDVTPEALSGLIGRMLPGVSEGLRAAGASHQPAALLSRQLAGVMETDPGNGIDRPVCLVALPGSLAAVRESWAVLRRLLPHLVDQLDGGDHIGVSHDGAVCQEVGL